MNQDINLKLSFDMNTTNQSFLDLHKYLKDRGIRNNKFFLAITNTDLLNIEDPWSEDSLSDDQRDAIRRECESNVFYYLREILRIPDGFGGVRRYITNPALMASVSCTLNYIDNYITTPRCTMKDIGTLALLSWVKTFHPYADIITCGRSDEDTKHLNYKLDKIINLLPDYLKPTDNKYLDTISYHQLSYRLCSEAEFTPHLADMIESELPTRNLGKKCTIYTSTPGNMNDDVCRSITDGILKDSIKWDNSYFDDKPFDMLKRLIKTKYRTVYIEYGYKDLGYNDEWFVKTCNSLRNDQEIIRREVLLERF